MTDSTCWSGKPDYVQRLEAEIARLRAALQKIANLQAQSYACQPVDVARAALKDTTPMPENKDA